MMILLVKLGLQPYKKDTKLKVFQKMALRRVLAERKTPLWRQKHGCKDNNIKRRMK